MREVKQLQIDNILHEFIAHWIYLCSEMSFEMNRNQCQWIQDKMPLTIKVLSLFH